MHRDIRNSTSFGGYRHRLIRHSESLALSFDYVLLQIVPFAELMAAVFAGRHAINAVRPSIKSLGIRLGLRGPRVMCSGFMRSTQAVCRKEATTVPAVKHGLRASRVWIRR